MNFPQFEPSTTDNFSSLLLSLLNMFAKLLILIALTLAIVADDKCKDGSVQCCNSVEAANSKTVQEIAKGNADIAKALKDVSVTTSIGITCSPVSAINTSSNSWSVPYPPLLFYSIDISPALPRPSAVKITASVRPHPLFFCLLPQLLITTF